MYAPSLCSTVYIASLWSMLGQALGFTVLETESLALSGDIVGRYFSVQFTPLSVNVAAKSDYLITVFQDGQIPYYGPSQAVASQTMQCPAPACSTAIEARVTETPYIVGIGSSNSVFTSSATLSFAPHNTSGVRFQSSLAVKWVGINSLVVAFVMPDGYQPATSGAWLGLWEGRAIAGVAPLVKVRIDSIQSRDTQAINGLHMQANAVYTVAFAAGPGVNDLHSLAVFQTASD